MTNKKIKTIDLFAGVGGIRIGFEQTGRFETVFANDFEPHCKLTYDLNNKTTKLTLGDIKEVKSTSIPQYDFLLGGFPCQAFSIAGYRKGFDDHKGRGNLFFEISRIIKDTQPRGFLLENVKNLQGHDGGNTFRVILKELDKLGYKVKYKVMNAMEYGNIPQNRERIYIVGFKNSDSIKRFNFPDKISLTTNFIDFLEPTVEERYYYNNKPLFERIKDKVNSNNKVYQWRRQYVRENKKGVVPTLTANMGSGGHNVPIIKDKKGIRKLTPKETFLIQGFPKDFSLPILADSHLYHQAGNSVVVPVIKRIADCIINAL